MGLFVQKWIASNIKYQNLKKSITRPKNFMQLDYLEEKHICSWRVAKMKVTCFLDL